MKAARASALSALSLALAGCATTSGQDWLNSPIDAPAATTTIYVSADSSGATRPRLRQTITLGESYAGTADSAAPAPNDGSSVHVNVATYVPVTINNYGTYPAVFDATVTPLPRATHSTSPQPGQDFPAPPSYGPSFPYQTSPASPWKR